MPSRPPGNNRPKQAPAWPVQEQVSVSRKSMRGQSGYDAELTERVRKWLREVGAETLAVKATIMWNARLKTTAGTACPKTSVIELNPLLKDFGPPQLQRTLKHEAAHLLAHWRMGRRHIQMHGPEWQQACADLGIPGEAAFHEMPLPRRRMPRKFAYRCRHCGLTVQRVRPFAPYTACYKCCQRLNAGKYHANFLFLRIPFPPAEK